MLPSVLVSITWTWAVYTTHLNNLPSMMKRRQQGSPLSWGVALHRASRIYWRVEEQTTWTRWKPSTLPLPATAVLLRLQVSLILSLMSSARKHHASTTKMVASLKSSHSMVRGSSLSSHQWASRKSTLFHTRKRIPYHVFSAKDSIGSTCVELGDPRRCRHCASS